MYVRIKNKWNFEQLHHFTISAHKSHYELPYKKHFFFKQSGHSMFLGNLFSNGELFLSCNQRYHHSILSNSLLPSYYMLSGPCLLGFPFRCLPCLRLTQSLSPGILTFLYFVWHPLLLLDFLILLVDNSMRLDDTFGNLDEKQALQLWSPHTSWSLLIVTSNLLSTPWIQSFWLLVMHICSKISFYFHLFYIDLYLFGYILQYKLGVEP